MKAPPSDAALVETLRSQLATIAEDYRYNLALVEERDTVIATLTARVKALQIQNDQLEGRAAAQVERIHMLEDELAKEPATLRKQLKGAWEERAELQRRCDDFEMRLSLAMQQLSTASTATAQGTVVAKRDARKEAEDLVYEFHRNSKLQEDALRRQLHDVMTSARQAHDELTALRRQHEECMCALERRDATVRQQAETIATLRRAEQERESEAQREHIAVVALREHAERTLRQQLHALQKNVDARSHEVELAEQRVVAMRTQHDVEIKRRQAELDDVRRVCDERLAAAQESLRESQVDRAKLDEERQRLKRRLAEANEARRTADDAATDAAIEVERLSAQMRQKDSELRRAQSASVHGSSAITGDFPPGHSSRLDAEGHISRSRISAPTEEWGGDEERPRASTHSQSSRASQESPRRIDTSRRRHTKSTAVSQDDALLRSALREASQHRQKLAVLQSQHRFALDSIASVVENVNRGVTASLDRSRWESANSSTQA